MSKTICLVGAGLAGSMLSIYLARQGFNVTVFESRPDLRKVDISAGRSINLALANRGLTALKELGLEEKVQPLLIPMKGRMLHDLAGELAFQAYGSKAHEVIYSVSRGELTSLLLDEAEATGKVDIRFNQACVAVDYESQQVSLKDHDSGDVYQHGFDCVFGTDGSASAVRQGTIQSAGGEMSISPLDHSYKELTLPAGLKGEFQIDKHSLHIWPRGQFMLIALPNMDGSFTITLFMPTKGGQHSFEDIQDETALMAFFDAHFPDFVPYVPDLTAQFFNNPTGHLATVKCHGWAFEDKGVILGDAAHAIVPFHGQGMNAAFESCRELDHQLKSSPEDWTHAFAEFERARVPNTNAIADMALENYIEMRSGVTDPSYVLKKAIAFELEKRFPGQFIPRYSMVMFHTLPYHQAKSRGAAQNEILNALTERAKCIEEVDFELAQRLIEGSDLLKHPVREETAL